MNSFGNTPSQNNWIFSNQSQVESLLNEMRGNLFEYLFAKNLANHFKILEKFERGINSELSDQFRIYQTHILQHFPDLPQKLLGLAEQAVGKFHEHRSILPDEVSDIQVVGKVTGQAKESQEADILLYEAPGNICLGISLKMMHVRGYVNTKSGGAQSFVEKYFQSITGVENYHDRFLDSVQSNYEQIVQKTCQILDIPTASISNGEWKNYLESRLPGQQPPEVREQIHLGYNKMILSLYEVFKEMHTAEPVQFKSCLTQLFGMTGANNVSVMCYYSKDYNLDDLDILTKDQLEKELEDLEIQAEAPEKSSFTINTPKYSLQVRIKPMNEFTVPSYKINCSVKKIG